MELNITPCKAPLIARPLERPVNSYFGARPAVPTGTLPVNNE